MYSMLLQTRNVFINEKYRRAITASVCKGAAYRRNISYGCMFVVFVCVIAERVCSYVYVCWLLYILSLTILCAVSFIRL